MQCLHKPLLFDITEQKMKISIKDFFSKCDQIRRKLVTFTGEILNGKLHFLCSDMVQMNCCLSDKDMLVQKQNKLKDQP